MKNEKCESCLVAGEHVPATTRSVNPDYAGYVLCQECAAEYDSRWLANTGSFVTLREALQLFDGQLLTDGADDWDQENYLAATENEKDGPEYLDQRVYISKAGIYEVRPDGHVGKAILAVK